MRGGIFSTTEDVVGGLAVGLIAYILVMYWLDTAAVISQDTANGLYSLLVMAVAGTAIYDLLRNWKE